MKKSPMLTLYPYRLDSMNCCQQEQDGGKATQSQHVLTDIISGTGRIRFRGVRFQTPNSVSFSALTEFRGANSVSSFQPIVCV